MSSSSTQPFVRPFRPGDEEAMVHVFRETADTHLRLASEPALHIASFAWCRPYYTLSPGTCFVLDNGNGTAVGYIIGTPDTAEFVRQWRERFIPLLEEEGILKPEDGEDVGWKTNLTGALRLLVHNPESLVHEQHPELVEGWPGHLHVDVLEGWQEKGWGRVLMGQWLGGMRKRGVRGVHLGMSASNVRAERFYERMGFGRLPVVVDGGASGEKGRDGRSVYMVQTLDGA